MAKRDFSKALTRENRGKEVGGQKLLLIVVFFSLSPLGEKKFVINISADDGDEQGFLSLKNTDIANIELIM